MNAKEKEMGNKIAVKVDEVRGSIKVASHDTSNSNPPKVFTFDRVFAPECKQTDVYNDGARPIVESVLEGYNGMLLQIFCLILSFHACIHTYIAIRI